MCCRCRISYNVSEEPVHVAGIGAHHASGQGREGVKCQALKVCIFECTTHPAAEIVTPTASIAGQKHTGARVLADSRCTAHKNTL